MISFFEKSNFIQPLLESRLFYRNILGGRSVVWPQHKIGWDTWGRGLEEEGWEMFSFLESSHIANHFPILLLKSRLIGMGKNIFFLGMFPCCLIRWYLFCPNNFNCFFYWSSTSFLSFFVYPSRTWCKLNLIIMPMIHIVKYKDDRVAGSCHWQGQHNPWLMKSEGELDPSNVFF